jgi:mannitol-1-/sugar-/sorbitol-6-phosphatase
MQSKRFATRAVLFDLDGVLVDSTAVVEDVWRRWARERGLEIEDLIPRSHGRRIADMLAELLPGTSVAQEHARLQELELSTLEGLIEIAGARAFLESFRTTPWAIVTSGARMVAQARLRKAGLPIPRTLVSAEDVLLGKPDPEPFLRALARLDIHAADSVVFEDAPAGIEAAKRAGSRVIAITTTHPAEALLAADAIITDLRSVRLDESGNQPLIELLARPRSRQA